MKQKVTATRNLYIKNLSLEDELRTLNTTKYNHAMFSTKEFGL